MNISKLSVLAQGILEEAKIRGMIAIFMFLVFKLNAIIAQPIEEQPTKLIIYGLLDLVSIILIPLLFADKRISRDMNELNFYSMIVHFAYLPMYKIGVPAIYHNTAINILLVLVVLRLVYFGRKTSDGDFNGWPTFGVLGLFRLWRENHNFTFKFFNHLPSLLFFGAAAPLWFISYRSNDSSVTMTVVPLMLLIFFMATKMNNQNILIAADQAKKDSNETKSETDTDTELLCNLFRSRSEEEQAAIMELVSTTFTQKNNPVTRHIKKTQDAEKERLAKYAERHYFLLARLMQLLPMDITNQPELTQEQIEMCLAVSTLAEKGVIVIEDGLELIDNLLFMAMHSKERRSLSNFDAFVAYLEEGAEFMRESASDYGDAANHIKKKEPPKPSK